MFRNCCARFFNYSSSKKTVVETDNEYTASLINNYLDRHFVSAREYSLGAQFKNTDRVTKVNYSQETSSWMMTVMYDRSVGLTAAIDFTSGVEVKPGGIHTLRDFATRSAKFRIC